METASFLEKRNIIKIRHCLVNAIHITIQFLPLKVFQMTHMQTPVLPYMFVIPLCISPSSEVRLRDSG